MGHVDHLVIQGGGSQAALPRIVDFRARQGRHPGQVSASSADPNRSAHLTLLCCADGERRYIIAAKGLTAAQQVAEPGRCADQGRAARCCA